MSIPETLGELRRTPAAVKAGAVIASLLIIAGCGESKNGIADCPSPEYYRDHAPVKRAEVLADMQFGTFALRSQIRLGGFKNTAVLTDVEPRLRAAAEDVFPVAEQASARQGEAVLYIGSDADTKLDEVRELVCGGNGGEYFPTLETSEAYADFFIAGIDVSK